MTPKRLLLLTTTTGYQTRSFVEAAGKIGLEMVFGTDRCHVLEDPWCDGAIPLRFEDPDESTRQVVDYARSNPLQAIVALGDRPTPTAARACRELGLPFHTSIAADTCRDKLRMRERLQKEGFSVPSNHAFPLGADPRRLVRADPIQQAHLAQLAHLAQSGKLVNGSLDSALSYPCVLKPRALSASRGVIRADNPEEFVRAFERIKALLKTPEIRVLREDTSDTILAEAYVEGQEIAVEGLVDRGRVKVLAIFDKPDPLTGPFFEETIYVTPSRLSPETQQEVIETLARACQALGLYHGPIHAELRINGSDAERTTGIWILEIAARSIGGLCARALRFTSPALGRDISLEELIIRLALAEDLEEIRREDPASGVMMIPIPQPGVFQEVRGVEQALATPGVEDIRITVRPNEKLVPLPEGSSYLGFIFARDRSPKLVEDALRRAHQRLHFVIGPTLTVTRG